MGLGPFMCYVHPGVYGPHGTAIEKSDLGYKIGWAPTKAWGTPWFEGSIKKLAKQLLIYYSNTLKWEEATQPTTSIVMDEDGAIEVSVFKVTFQPTVTCRKQKSCSF